MDENQILKRAERRPGDVVARIAAAYHCDAHRTEEEAIVHYDAAWNLGVPADQRRGFALGYGSTLKNVGRFVESEAVLRDAIAENPTDEALPAFLALTLHAAGKSALAVAELLDVLVSLGEGAPNIQRYTDAITHYADELRGSSPSDAETRD